MAKMSSFRWAEIPGKDNDRLIDIISKKISSEQLYRSGLLSPNFEWIKKATITKSDSDGLIIISDGEKSCSISLKDETMYLFSWDEIPGKDNDILIEFLIQNYDLNWVRTAKINKADKKTIEISDGSNLLSLRLNHIDKMRLRLNLTTNDGITDEFVVKTESGYRNIYEKNRAVLKTDDGRKYELKVMKIRKGGEKDFTTVVYFEEQDSLEKIGDTSFNIAAVSEIVVKYILVPVALIALLVGQKTTSWDMFTFGKIIVFILIPILFVIGCIAWKINPFEGKWRKVAVLISFIPLVAVFPVIYYIILKGNKEMEDIFLGIICGFLFILMMIVVLYSEGMGWIGYCAGNEFCINGISIKWDKIFQMAQP
ncbi:MAG: hypothetical protein O8C64_04715 [Candidatus Methanoperedens sp.]|nr:hypothetical protein [Candidatus Methanoperedens sp.]MCZ7404323.1 hypothetical protein [Candidatus Methanoperedens sp.]